MNQDRDLLPWIFGGLSMATVAIAVTVGSTNGTAPKYSQTPSHTAAQILPEPVATAALAPAPAQTLAAAQIQTPGPQMPASPAPASQGSAPPIEPNSQIWQCTINGQKTFSDSPCGGKPSLREISPINRMDPTPIFPHARTPAPESSYQPEYSNQGQGYQGYQEDSNPGEQPYATNSYPVFIGIPVREPSRPDAGHRPHSHDRGPPPPHGPPPPPHGPPLPRMN